MKEWRVSEALNTHRVARTTWCWGWVLSLSSDPGSHCNTTPPSGKGSPSSRKHAGQRKGLRAQNTIPNTIIHSSIAALCEAQVQSSHAGALMDGELRCGAQVRSSGAELRCGALTTDSSPWWEAPGYREGVCFFCFFFGWLLVVLLVVLGIVGISLG